MTASVKSRILDNIQSTLESISTDDGDSLTPTAVTRTDRPIAETTVFPSITFHSPSDTPRGTDLVGMNDVQHRTMRVVVRCHVRTEDSLDGAEADVIKHMLSDPFRGQLAHYTELAGASLFDTVHQFVDVMFDVRFSHLRNDPSVRA